MNQVEGRTYLENGVDSTDKGIFDASTLFLKEKGGTGILAQ